ncbi:hypothetical protein Dimus_018334 [Dionaea muscipula]
MRSKIILSTEKRSVKYKVSLLILGGWDSCSIILAKEAKCTIGIRTFDGFFDLATTPTSLSNCSISSACSCLWTTITHLNARCLQYSPKDVYKILLVKFYPMKRSPSGISSTAKELKQAEITNNSMRD